MRLLDKLFLLAALQFVYVNLMGQLAGELISDPEVVSRIVVLLLVWQLCAFATLHRYVTPDLNGAAFFKTIARLTLLSFVWPLVARIQKNS